MVGRLIDEIATQQYPEVKALINLMGKALIPHQYEQLIQSQLSSLQNFNSRKPLLNLGHFTGSDLLQLLLACGCESGAHPHIVAPLLARLIEWSLVLDNRLMDVSHTISYLWNKPQIAKFFHLKILDNILLGQSYIAQKYSQSVPAIIVEKDNAQQVGTGFLVADTPGADDLVIVTAKHCVNPGEGIKYLELIGQDGVTYTPLQKTWLLHPKLDLAAMPVKCSEDDPVVIYPVGTSEVLTKTVTLGYPAIAFSDRPYILAHAGEINSTVKFYNEPQEHLLISNAVAPGNSGGPILNEAGLCVGMVVRELETKHESGVSKANAALPAGEILEFINSF